MSKKNKKSIFWRDIQKAIEKKSQYNDPDALAPFLLQENQKEEYNKEKSEARELKYYYLGERFPTIYLTKREAECMHFLLEGFTNDEAAEVLNLSARTIEFYIKKMRGKVGAHTKQQLINIIRSTAFIRATHIEKDAELLKHAEKIQQKKKLLKNNKP